MTTENRWGCLRIANECKALGFTICKETVRRIQREAGLDPAPERTTTWKAFLKSHCAIWGCDFFTQEVLYPTGLVTFYVLFFMNIRTKKVVIGGITTNPDDDWMKVTARRVTEYDSEIANSAAIAKLRKQNTYLLRDRDGKFSENFDKLMNSAGIEVIKLPPRSPNLNAHAERFVRSIKEECLNHLIFIGEKSLRTAIENYVEHYECERTHQGLKGAVPFTIKSQPIKTKDSPNTIVKKARLNGLLNFYHRKQTD